MKFLSATMWLVVGLLAPAAASACDDCFDDKMAAIYDDAVVEKAAAQKRVVVFCDVQGQVKPELLRAAAAKVPGLDLASVRTSSEPAAMSFALDPKVLSTQAAVAKLSDALGGKGLVTVTKELGPGLPTR